MRKIVIVFLFVAFILVSCTNKGVSKCEHCKEEKVTQNRLVDVVDMQLCDECYQGYLGGEWTVNNLK